MAKKKSNDAAKFKKTAKKIISKGKTSLGGDVSNRGSTVVPIGKRGNRAVGRRGKK